MIYLVVEMSDKTQWAIPAILIAEHRARHYAALEGEGVYPAEIAYAMSDDYEIKDWAANNMNWEDVCHEAIKLEVKLPKANYHKDWINAPKHIKEVEL